MNKIDLSEEQRAFFGLEDGESIRVLSRRRRTIVLERMQSGGALAFPWDRDLVFDADVASFPLADVLQLLHSSSKSGFLCFHDEDHEKAVYLHRGEVVFAASNQSFDRLTNCLLRAGRITQEQFDEADRAYKPPGRIGKLFVERGFLTPGELWNGVKVQVEEIVRSLFSYDAGCVLFWEGEVRPDNIVRLSLPTQRLISEGLRRRDELFRFLAMIEDSKVSLEREQNGKSSFTGTERNLLEMIDAGSSFSDICRRAGVEPLAGARAIRHLTLSGAVRVSREPQSVSSEVPDDAQQSSDEAIRSCVIDHLKLMAELAMPIIAVENVSGIQERIANVVEEASCRYPELFSGLRIGKGGTIDPEDLIARALRFPGERDREVRLALGELISYVEFELMNHPKISDPEDFLEGTTSLRANL